MGINSTEVAYGFGQLGSGFVNTLGAFTPPTGKVIVAIQFLADTELSGLVADTSQIDITALTPNGVAGNTGFFDHSTATVAVPNFCAQGNGADPTQLTTGPTTTTVTFPRGLTIYGRWTSVTLKTANSAGGFICYFGQ